MKQIRKPKLKKHYTETQKRHAVANIRHKETIIKHTLQKLDNENCGESDFEKYTKWYDKMIDKEIHNIFKIDVTQVKQQSLWRKFINLINDIVKP